ncbi:MAG: hypothetical protein R2699_15105 [Acidimicrobiales bacterium]
MSYWNGVTHNWNNVVNGGLTIGASPSATSTRIWRATSPTRRSPACPAPWRTTRPRRRTAGVSYWEYATEYTGYTIAALQDGAGFGPPDSATCPEFAQTGDVPVHMVGPTGQRFNWADDGELRFAPSVPFLFRLAERFERAVDWHSTPWRTPDRMRSTWCGIDQRRVPTDPPRDHLFTGVDVATMRSAWGDPAALFVATKGGTPGENTTRWTSGPSCSALRRAALRPIDLGREN